LGAKDKDRTVRVFGCRIRLHGGFGAMGRAVASVR
jgi:hypothetical protein